MSGTKKNRWSFFLGGHDLEMITIRDLLRECGVDSIFDKGLSWGAKTSDYREEIEACIQEGRIPVLIELVDDLGLAPDRVIVVDHHGELAGRDRPTALEQVFQLLGLPPERWMRWLALVAANDRGYIPELVRMGATREEIEKIRAADRVAQGITEEQEVAAKQAVEAAEVLAGGALTVVRLPHSRTSAVVDRLDPTLNGPGYENLLVVSPGQVNFFGSGDLVRELDREFPGGWYGGGLPEQGFWGHPDYSAEEIVSFLTGQRITASSARIGKDNRRRSVLRET